jgi:competence protein ComEC
MLLGLISAVGGALDWSRRRTLLVAVPLVGVYVLLSGAGPAAVRSALMAGAALLARTGARRTDPLPMLALVAALMLGIDPRLVVDPGFQLSFLGTAGILVLAGPLAARVPGPRLLAEPFAVTVAAQLATVPVMAGTFGVIAIDGPVANALVLPLLPALIVEGGGGALLAAITPALGWLPLHAAGLVTGAVVLLARLLSAVPGAAIQVGTWPLAWTIAEIAGLAGGVAVLAVSMRRARRRAQSPALVDTARPPVVDPNGHRRPGVATVRFDKRRAAAAGGAAIVVALATLAITSRPDGRLHVTVLDTAAAPAVLVRTGDGGSALIDGGASPAVLLQALGRVLPATTRRIDMVVVTGGEPAAVAGLSALPGHYDIGVVMVTPDLNPGAAAVINSLQQAGATVIDFAGRSWRWGGADWRCLGFTSASSGRAMCALRVADGSGRLLVLGDAGTADQEEICAVYGGALGADVVVGPPGGAVAQVLLDTVRAGALAVPSVGGGRGAPAPAGITVARTGADGDLLFAGGPAGLIWAR